MVESYGIWERGVGENDSQGLCLLDGVSGTGH
jgi:hypothetical protein